MIRVRGARTHNLQNIEVDIPRHQLVVITGLSGSGKSSLAFDTLYAEGHRRYVESLSPYARQFLQLMDKPDVDSIEGLSPAISIEQKATSHNPRSTVGTVTEIHDHLRLLYARAGTPFCPDHPQMPLQAQSISQMVDTLLGLPEGTRWMVLAPVVRHQQGDFSGWFAQMQSQGYIRFRVNGEVLDVDSLPVLSAVEKHHLDVVVDRVKVAHENPALRQRLAESFESALRLSEGRALAVDMDSGATHWFSNRFACPVCSYALNELQPQLFSFNSPVGACPTCEGLGHVTVMDPQRVVAFPSLSLAGGAVKGWDRRNPHAFAILESLARHFKVDIETPFENLPENVQRVILYGSGEEVIEFTDLRESTGHDGQVRERQVKRMGPFEGLLPYFARRLRESESVAVREDLARYQTVQTCPDCQGSRLRREARHVFLQGEGACPGEPIDRVSDLTLGECLSYFEGLKLRGAKAAIGQKLIQEIRSRLQFLNNVGLNYLSLDRSASTLSGGEAQRIRLASQIGSGLSGVMYVLDEPSIGLHQRDNDRLIATLRHLRDLGNSVLVVEHDEDAIRAADHVIDMGPGAGIHGGRVMAQGTPQAIMADPQSLTGRYLCRALSMPIPPRRPVSRHAPGKACEGWLRITGARGHNLKNITVDIPVARLTCVTGVSGSGKSTLVNDTLYAAVARHLHGSQLKVAPYDKVIGLEAFDKVINVDQSPIGRTPRSNPATYTGLLTPVRELFAEMPMARERGYAPGRFSFNVEGGRCEACQGDGLIRVEMHFLPDVHVPCDVCLGKRYNRETLEVLYKGHNIHQVLELTVEDASEFFKAIPAISRRLQTLMDVGLGYVRLGQNATTLSGGEAQRVKLALELSKRDTGRTLYILDEPTTGLHFSDIALLLKVLQQLCDAGNTLVVIEHNLDVIKSADWLIDMGPEGGGGGGEVLATGTPEMVADHAESHTGRYLARVLRVRNGASNE